MNLLTAIEQWVDARAAKQVEIRMTDVARMVYNDIQKQLETSTLGDLESRVDTLESTVESHDNGIDELEVRIDDLDSRLDDVDTSIADTDDHISHGEVADLVRDVINNASISFNL